jgi:hypothetical protein
MSKDTVGLSVLPNRLNGKRFEATFPRYVVKSTNIIESTTRNHRCNLYVLPLIGNTGLLSRNCRIAFPGI